MIRPTYAVVRRAVDVAGSATGLGLSAPILLAAAIAIKVEDRGPVIFRQTRVGRNGQPFTILKLRTMSVDAPANATSPQMAPMNHVTTVGRVLRRTNLDELPQLVNVLRGDMSIIGPRPALPSQRDLLDARSDAANSLRPGLTGLAQVSSYERMPPREKARFDSEYASDVNARADIRILRMTATYLRKPPPAY